MPTSSTNLSFQIPVVGSDTNTWGTYLNANWNSLDSILWGGAAIRPNLTAGAWQVGGVAVTATAAELNTLDGITATVAELNKLDGVTATTAEINYLSGVTSAIQTQLNGKQPLDAELTAIAGLTSAANKIPMFSGSGTATLIDRLDEDDFASDSATGVPTQQSTKAYIDTAIPAKLNASGSAPLYGVRAWVNFNGTGTPAITAAGNVSSITDNGVGDFTLNFTTALPSANYAVMGAARLDTSAASAAVPAVGIYRSGTALQAGSARVAVNDIATGNAFDADLITVSVVG